MKDYITFADLLIVVISIVFLFIMEIIAIIQRFKLQDKEIQRLRDELQETRKDNKELKKQIESLDKKLTGMSFGRYHII